MCEGELEFPEGWGLEKNSFCGESMGIFWNYTIHDKYLYQHFS